MAARLAIVGEYTPSFAPHAATDAAIEHAGVAIGAVVRADWISTADLADDVGRTLAGYDGIWVAPGSPYKSMQGALNAIRFGRETDMPLLATCGGCQHVVIEYARNVLDFRDAEHAEYDPYASNLFVTPLSCSLVGQTMEVRFDPASRIAAICGAVTAAEQYYCNFGINPEHQQKLDDAGLRIVGRDVNGEARVLTLPRHPFFVATLFVPQLRSTLGRPHPLICEFLTAVLARHARAIARRPTSRAAALPSGRAAASSGSASRPGRQDRQGC